jgi:predicted butyrate kinase (DUF1464 family)
MANKALNQTAGNVAVLTGKLVDARTKTYLTGFTGFTGLMSNIEG